MSPVGTPAQAAQPPPPPVGPPPAGPPPAGVPQYGMPQYGMPPYHAGPPQWAPPAGPPVVPPPGYPAAPYRPPYAAHPSAPVYPAPVYPAPGYAPPPGYPPYGAVPPTPPAAYPPKVKRPPGRVGQALRGVAGLFGTTARLIWRHWPVLFAFYLAGATLRELAMRGAVKAASVHATAGVALLVLAPLATLSAIVLMLRAVRPSLPALDTAQAENSTQKSRWGPLDTLASALVPFLAVYASYGYLRDDQSQYAYRVWESTLGLQVNIEDRLPFNPTTSLLILVLVAFALRFIVPVMRRLGRVGAWALFGLVGAWAEATWLVPAVAYYQAQYQKTTAWLGDRRVVAWVVDAWDRLADALGPFGAALHGTVGWILDQLDSFGAVIVLPVAWLVTGAVVYGRSIMSDPPTAEELYERAARTSSAPRAVLLLRAKVSSNLRNRFGPLLQGFGVLFRAGVVPMLLFCLAFVVADGLGDWLWQVERVVIGPQDLATVWVSLDRPLALFNDGIRTVLIVCLLAAAIERVVRARPAAVHETTPDREGAIPAEREPVTVGAPQDEVVSRA